MAGVTGVGLGAGFWACAGEGDGRTGCLLAGTVPLSGGTTAAAGLAGGFDVVAFERLGFELEGLGFSVAAADFVERFLAVVFPGGDGSTMSFSDGALVDFFGLPPLRITSADISRGFVRTSPDGIS